MTLACAALCGQIGGVGNITGLVTDASGAVMAGVNLEVRNTATGVTSTAVSNAAGNYLVANLIPGRYLLAADAQGFKKYVRSGLTVQVGETLRVDIAMQIGAVNETVDVVGQAPLIETETGSLGEVIDNRKITQLPLIGRNVYSLMTLVPGSAPDHSGRTRINGSRSRSNEFLVDGVTQMVPETRSSPVGPPPIDSIEEFKILTSTYSVEYGNASGGLVNVATRSGTNRLQATFWEFLRNDKLNTRNFFAPPGQAKPVLRYNQFGAAGGGPVLLPRVYDGRNRTFFFGDFEGTRVRQQRVFNVTVPTAAMRDGNFSGFLGPRLGNDAAGREVLQGQIYDPQSGRVVASQQVRDPFPNNVVPRTRMDAPALKLLEYWPQPTLSTQTQNFVRATATGSDTNRFDLRGDHQISSGHKAFARFSRLRTDNLPAVPFRGSSGDNDSNVTEKTLSGAWNAIAGGWQVSGVATLACGRPFDIEQSTNTTATFSLMQRPNIGGNPKLGRSERSLDRFLDTSRFSAAAPLTFGTSPRNPVRGPGLVNFDLAVIKEWAIQEKRAVEFRFEMFNLSNTPPFAVGSPGASASRMTYNPNLALDRQSFGRITTAGDGRIVQFALKLRL
jgi:hypothetical protein